MKKFPDEATKKAQFKIAYFESGSINRASKIVGVTRLKCQKWMKEFELKKEDMAKQKKDYEDILAHECFDAMIENVKIGVAIQNQYLKNIDTKNKIDIEKNIDKVTRIVGVTCDKVLKLVEIRHEKLIVIDSKSNRTIIDLRRENEKI